MRRKRESFRAFWCADDEDFGAEIQQGSRAECEASALAMAKRSGLPFTVKRDEEGELESVRIGSYGGAGHGGVSILPARS